MSYLFTPNTNIRNSNTDSISNSEPLPIVMTNVPLTQNVSFANQSVAIYNSNNVPVTNSAPLSVQVVSNTSNYVYTQLAPTWQLDALSKLRTSTTQTQFWHVPIVDDDTQFRFSSASNGAGANVTFMANTSENILYSGTANGGYTYYQSRVRYKIVPGISHTVYNTVNWNANTSDINTTRRAGLFGANNGLFWEQTANTLAVVVRRTIANGQITEDRVYANSFNVDKLDGTGASGYNIFSAGLDKYYTFWFDFIGGRTGRVRFGMGTTAGPTICHTFNYSGIISTNFVTDNSLPLRTEIFNTNTHSTSPSFGISGKTFQSEAILAFDPFPTSVAHTSGYIPGGADTAMITIGLRNAFPYTRGDITPGLVELIDGNNQSKNGAPATFIYKIIYNANVNGTYAYSGNGALSNANTGRASQYWTWANTATATGGQVVKQGLFNSSVQEMLNILPGTFNLGTDINGNPDTLTITIRQLAAGGNTAAVYCTFDFLEQL